MMKTLIKNFLKCGLTGWYIEIIFTSLTSYRKSNKTLKGQTSLWMFPIYGSISLFTPVFKLFCKTPAIIRGSIYAVMIFIGEFISGRFLQKRNLCPWNYSQSRFHIKEVIRLDYFPNWFLCGLLFEHLLTGQKNVRKAV